MKKIIFAITGAAMMVAATILYSCNKEERTTMTDAGQSSTLVTKGNTQTLSLLQQNMVAVYAACDRAYTNDSVSFIKACEENDTAMFLKLTGISDSLLDSYRKQAMREAKEYAASNPEFRPEEGPCKECSKDALLKIGKIVAITHGNTASLAQKPIDGNNRIYLEHCILNCKTMETAYGMAASISACMGEHLVSPDGWYKRNYTMEDGSECLEEYLIVNFEVKAKRTNNEADNETLPSHYYVKYFEEDAFALVDILAEEYDCVIMIRTEHSASHGIFGRPFVDWVIYYGNMDENGDCL